MACLLVIAGLIWSSGGASAQTHALPADGDFGGAGIFSVYVDSLTNPYYPIANGRTMTVAVYHPDAPLDPARPTIFIAHGFISPIGDPVWYAALLNNLASHGYNVVFSPYEGTGAGANGLQRFDEMVTGFLAVVSQYGLNTNQVGFVGHSYGAGFLPVLIQHLMMGKSSWARPGNHWGNSAAFMFDMAPTYAVGVLGGTGVAASQSIQFPPNLNVVVQVFKDDTSVCDPRVAMDIFFNITTLNSKKRFLTVFGDNHGSPTLVANHNLPNSSNTDPAPKSLQSWAIFRRIDALAAYTFTGDSVAFQIALGGGTSLATDEGVWSDGVPVTPLGVTNLPSPDAYFPGPYSAATWTSGANPRVGYPLVIGPPGLIGISQLEGDAQITLVDLLIDHQYLLQTSASLTPGSWSEAQSFTAGSTSETLTESIAHPAGQFWRVEAP